MASEALAGVMMRSQNHWKTERGAHTRGDALDAVAFPRGSRSSLFLGVLRRYPRATIGVLLTMLLAKVVESFGILSLLPLMQSTIAAEANAAGHLSWLRDGIAALGLSGSFGTTLLLICIALLIGQ